MEPITKTIDTERLIGYLKKTRILEDDKSAEITPEACYEQLAKWIAQLEYKIGSFLAVVQGFGHKGMRAALRRGVIAQEYGVDEDFVSEDRPYVSEVDDDHLCIRTPEREYTLEIWGEIRK